MAEKISTSEEDDDRIQLERATVKKDKHTQPCTHTQLTLESDIRNLRLGSPSR